MTQELWTFKYEPKTLDEMILNDKSKEILFDVIENVPNVLLCGKPGTGKGTFMNILLNETKYDYLKINASDENSVDDVRTKIKSFATALGFSKKKIVYLNECDAMSVQGQMAIRDLSESVQNTCRFFFVCNYPNKITDPIKSRCQTITLNEPPTDLLYKHCLLILKKENITIKNKKGIVNIIKEYYPDIRQIINTLQLNSKNGVFDNIVISSNSNLYNVIFNLMQEKKIDELRKTLKSESVDYVELYNFLFEKAPETKSPGDFIINIGEYLYRDSSIAIKEINFMTFFFKLLKEGIF